MPKDFAARILECDVLITDVLDVMTQAVNALLLCRPLDTTGATEHERPALRMKEPHEILASWEELFKMRRLVENDDMKVIPDAKVRTQIHSIWMHKWFETELTAEQREKSASQQASFFSAWVRNEYGSKRFVMAIIETGLSWAMPSGAVCLLYTSDAADE